ncbi:MAG: RidA family protein [Paludibacteraceae bacterium]|nr:RidA family protein [Paludibacteraceae bacterium]
MKKKISTPKCPQAVGPYSQAILINNTLYTSGQIAINPETGLMVENAIDVQTRQVMTNLQNLLSESGFSFDDVVKTTVFLKNMDDFATVNAIYAEYFKENAPARSCVAVSSLPKNALIEVEVIASK